jgi:hypothetical protein
MEIIAQDQMARLVAEAKRETRSKAACRLVDYLLVNQSALTHEVARDCAIGNISCAAGYIRPALNKRGLDIVATPPARKIRNRFGEPCQVHEWRIAAAAAGGQ